MEFNARYGVTGFFVILVTLAMFGFVYWLKKAGGFGEQAVYQVRFSVPVSGLARGSSVLFNGIKIGDVSRVRFDPQRPGDLLATITVAKSAPIRTDTVAGVDYQGLTGAANILLTGGSADAQALLPSDGKQPEIAADPVASRSWMQNAGRVLGRLDEMLSRNSGRFDSILAGLERMTGGGTKEESTIFDLPVPADFPGTSTTPDWQLAVSEPAVTLSLNTDKILAETSQNSLSPIAGGRWADNLPNLIQGKIVQSFENAGYTNFVLRPGDALDPAFKLVLDIRAFSLATGDNPLARIDIVARVINRDGAVIASRRFMDTEPAAGTDGAAAAAALGLLFSRTAAEMVNWTVSAI
jgi:phospholipid/cholesterol/gamma-HCH transport system substrate-binding protein